LCDCPRASQAGPVATLYKIPVAADVAGALKALFGMGDMGREMDSNRSIELEDHYRHHLRAWRLKRMAWAVMFLIILAGFAGFLGPGPYSKAKLQSTGGLHLEYERIARYNAPTHFRVTVPAGKDDLELSLNSEFLRQIDIERIDPEPKEMRLEGDRETWTFARGTGEKASEIRISFRPEGFGSAPAHLTVREVGELKVKPFFLP
jgi:hypothetical protein